jgi:hypothetical protein
MTYIFEDDLEFIKNNLITLPYEICGHILDKNEYKGKFLNTPQFNDYDTYPSIRGILWYDVNQESKEERLQCIHSMYSKIMFHTHPNVSKFYPSTEDIIKSIFFSQHMTSLIFSSIGIWDLKSTDNSHKDLKSNNRDKYERLKTEYHANIRADLAEIYNHTYRSKINSIPNGKFDSVLSYLKDFFDKKRYERIYKITIKFTPYKEIRNKYIVF